MRWLRWTTCLWPGLRQLWFEGSWSGLALAVGFSLLLNSLLLVSLVWTELIEPPVLRFGWLALAAAWAGSLLVLGWGNRAPDAAQRAASGEGLFQQALAEYLRGAWFEAESLWSQLLAAEPRDAECRLMLATLWRRTRRWDEAEEQLAELERLDGAARWRAEIEQEKQWLAEARRQPQTMAVRPATNAGALAQAA